MCKMKISLCIILFMSIAFALDFPLTTNVDADVTFKNGGQTHSVTTVGGAEQTVSISWITSQMSIEISAIPKNNRYKDSTFTTTLGASSVAFPAWDANQAYTIDWTKVSHNGKNWENRWYANVGEEPGINEVWREIVGEQPIAITINLKQKPLPTDTAFVPIYSNVDVQINISSSVASGTVTLAGKSGGCVLELPLEGSGLTINNENLVCGGVAPNPNPTSIGGKKINGGAVASQKISSAKLVLQHGYHLLSLSQNSYKNGEIRIISTNGKIVSSNKLSGVNQTSVTVSNVAAGIYLLNATGINGANFTSKIFHRGGDLRIAASFSELFEIGGIVNSRTISTASATRAGNVSYILTASSQSLGDTTINLAAVGGINTQINIYFNDPNATPSAKFAEIMTGTMYNAIFPNRYGLGRAECANAIANADPNCSKGKAPTGPYDGDYDYYSYESFLKAIDLVGEIEVDYEFGAWSGLFRMTWRNKRTGVTKVITHPQFTTTSETVTIDYADYCNSGDLNTRKRELAASLAHMTQETGGYGTSGDQHFHWGLYWRQEAGFTSESRGYQEADQLGYYPANPSKSYHGRGPKQLSYPYNYGPFSEFLYGDKNVLLNDPDKLCPPKPEDATVAFASAIWFWMTPQPPKPSSHDVMTDKVAPQYIIKDRAQSRFGWTISIINGGVECGAAGDIRANNRIQHYKRYMQILGVSDETADYGCYNMN